MFIRLLKYDFRSMLKQFALIWPAALVLALVNRFTLSGMESTSTTGETVAGVAMLVYVVIMIAMFVIAVIFVIQRFYKGLLGGEGYLMHTLPVQPWELISSKLVCAVTVTIVSILVAIVSILIICLGFLPLENFRLSELFRWFRLILDLDVLNMLVFLAEIFLAFVAGMAQSYLMLYLAMAVGHLFSKNRVAMSVVAYIAIHAAVSTLIGFFGGIFNGPLSRVIGHMLWDAKGWGEMHIAVWVVIVSTSAIGALYFFLTSYILKNKLNLE